jgi:hypothetical protein
MLQLRFITNYTAFCNLLPKSDEEPCGIAFNLPRVRRPNHVFDVYIPSENSSTAVNNHHMKF